MGCWSHHLPGQSDPLEVMGSTRSIWQCLNYYSMRTMIFFFQKAASPTKQHHTWVPSSQQEAWKSPEQGMGRQTMNLGADSREREPAEGALVTNFSELLEHLKSRSLYHLFYESVEDLAG